MYTAKGLKLIVGTRYKCRSLDGSRTSTWVCTKVPQNDFELVGAQVEAQVEAWKDSSPGLRQYTDANLRNPALGWVLGTELAEEIDE